MAQGVEEVFINLVTDENFVHNLYKRPAGGFVQKIRGGFYHEQPSAANLHFA
jgi:hypothetical protein